MQDVLEGFAEGCCQQSHLRYDAVGQAGARVQYAFVDQLAGLQRRHMVLEDHRNDGQPELRDGAHLLRVGNAHHGRFDGEGHQLLHLDGGHAGRRGDDAHLVVSKIGKSVDGDVEKRVDAGHDQRRASRQDQPGTVEEEVDE